MFSEDGVLRADEPAATLRVKIGPELWRLNAQGGNHSLGHFLFSVFSVFLSGQIPTALASSQSKLGLGEMLSSCSCEQPCRVF
jgi:hypothetical protein